MAFIGTSKKRHLVTFAETKIISLPVLAEMLTITVMTFHLVPPLFLSEIYYIKFESNKSSNLLESLVFVSNGYLLFCQN